MSTKIELDHVFDYSDDVDFGVEMIYFFSSAFALGVIASVGLIITGCSVYDWIISQIIT